MTKKKVELLAPAGSPESFYAAVNAGADAIYFAGSKFGARAYAANFSEEEVIKAINYAHLFHVRVYMTVNTLLKDMEIQELYSYILPYYEAGLDGVIIQDMGVFHLLKKYFPKLELHISTQASLCTPDGAEYMKEQGACRIVPAREISLAEIKAIKEKVDIQIESFIHGAMCYCYSGQCLFSSILGGRSGNRGRCAQPCRLPYSLKGNKFSKDGHLLSLKDMCMIYQLPDLIEAGIDSFKIEGRMKRPEYVAGVCAIYRKYIDAYYSLKEKYGTEQAKAKFQISKDDSKILNSLYIRSEIQNGYYYKHNGKEMITLDSPAYSETSDSILAEIQEKYVAKNRKLPVSIYGYFETGDAAIVTITYRDFSISVEGQIVDTASKSPITEENVIKQLSKMGDTIFAIDTIFCQVGENAFYPLKAINELRREACSQLTAKLLEQYPQEERQAIPWSESIHSLTESIVSEYKVIVSNMEQLETVIQFQNSNADKALRSILIDGDCYVKNRKQIQKMIFPLKENLTFGLCMPYVIRKRDETYLQEVKIVCEEDTFLKTVLVRSMDSLAFAKKCLSKQQIIADAGVYTWNSESLDFFSDQINSFTIPYELKAGEQKHLPLKKYSFDKIIYSRIPMMITANCVRNTAFGCQPNDGCIETLRDRYDKEFPVVTKCDHCYNIIYNSLPFSLHKEIGKWEGLVNFRLDFTIEKKDEVNKILTYFLKEKCHGEAPYAYTTGHEKRGVE